ncbi:MAG: hypothetical protein HYU66_10090 [Armatimonadetes bacterium]|nr:hypothetical protein [Armatimonadota bacterium]
MGNRPEDTSPAMWRKYIELTRTLSPGRKLKQTLELADMVWHMAMRARQELDPTASDFEIRARVAAALYGVDLVKRATGWEPTAERRA